MIRILICFLLFNTVDLYAQSAERVESEYKLGIPNDEAGVLWKYLQSDGFLSKLRSEYDLITEVSIEDFVDVYYDDEKSSLYKQKVGLRYRSRYIQDTLNKRIIQLKTPLLEDGVARTETKYEIKKSKDKNDIYARHKLLRYLKKKDRGNLNYQLAKFDSESLKMKPAVMLRQMRSRIYITDSIASLATITLDEVTNLKFPFQRYTEMELELNEIRYTNSDEEGKKKMERFNEKLRNGLLVSFPSLYQDQTPKYNKMKQIIDASWLSKLYKYRMWIILSFLVSIASYLLLFRK
ncbi:MAG: hypothetical protein ACI9P5_001810 [Saprospiraceae bacterium]|jgi:hypothetical protein|tara:strand:- start:1517 stop:2395 length:879 start_codon:yes stop_codon:yes gene_type:complete